MLDRHHAWASDRARSRQHHSSGYVVCSWRAAIALRSAKALKETGLALLHGTPVVRGRFRPNLAQGLADLQDGPLTAAWSGPSNKENGRRAPIVPFHEFPLGVPGLCGSRSLPPSRLPYTGSRPARRPGPWFGFHSASPPGGLAKQLRAGKSCLTKRTWPVARANWRSGWPGGRPHWSGLLVFAGLHRQQARQQPSPRSHPPPDRPPTIRQAGGEIRRRHQLA